MTAPEDMTWEQVGKNTDPVLLIVAYDTRERSIYKITKHLIKFLDAISSFLYGLSFKTKVLEIDNTTKKEILNSTKEKE